MMEKFFFESSPGHWPLWHHQPWPPLQNQDHENKKWRQKVFSPLPQSPEGDTLWSGVGGSNPRERLFFCFFREKKFVYFFGDNYGVGQVA